MGTVGSNTEQKDIETRLQTIQSKRSVQLPLCSSHLYTTIINANHRNMGSENTQLT